MKSCRPCRKAAGHAGAVLSRAIAPVSAACRSAIVQSSAEKITGEKFRGDPEYIDEGKLQSHGDVYTNNKLTRAEWDAWLLRNPQVVRAGSTRSGKTTFFSTIVKETLSGSGGPKGTIEL